MYAEVAWVLVSSWTQVQPQIILDPDYLLDYLSIPYDYDIIQATTNVLTWKVTINHRGRVIDFGNLLLYLPNTLPLRILEKLNFCYNQYNEEITPPPQIWKPFVKYFWKTSISIEKPSFSMWNLDLDGKTKYFKFFDPYTEKASFSIEIPGFSIKRPEIILICSQR